MNKKIGSIVEKELNNIGTIIQAKNENMEGFAGGNILNIQIGNVCKWDGVSWPSQVLHLV